MALIMINRTYVCGYMVPGETYYRFISVTVPCDYILIQFSFRNNSIFTEKLQKQYGGLSYTFRPATPHVSISHNYSTLFKIK